MLDSALCVLIQSSFFFVKKGRVHSLDSEPIADAFEPKTKRKVPKHFASLAKNDVCQGMNEDAKFLGKVSYFEK